MKNQQWKSGVYTVLLLIVVGITGVCTWWFSHDEQEAAVQYRAEPVVSGQSPAPTQVAGPIRDLRPLITPAQAKELDPSAHPVTTMFKSFFTEEQLATPEVQRYVKIVESPEYAEFIETKPSTAEHDAFLAAHGIYNDSERFTKHFREQFPTGEPADFEPEMRSQLSQMFAGLTEEQLQPFAGYFTEIVTDFLGNKRNHAWVAGQFQGDGFGKWVADVMSSSRDETQSEMTQQAPIPADIDETLFDSAPPGDIPEERAEALPDVDTFPDVDQMDEGNDIGTFTNVDIEAELEKQFLSELPELPTEERFEESIENALSARFNPERFHHAMETLNQYGPEEGIRRLQESDPEVAEQVKHLLQKRGLTNTKEDSNEK